jgi:hypothetical protein
MEKDEEDEEEENNSNLIKKEYFGQEIKSMMEGKLHLVPVFDFI